MNRTTSSDSTTLRRTESYQYPNAHFNHLDTAQHEKLEQFKKLCAEKGYYRPASEEHSGPSHDDETMLRYLRARKFIPSEAWKQFKDTEDWRKDNEIDKLYDTIEIDEYDESRKLYPQWTGRRDKRGIPVYVFEVAGLTSKRMAEYQHSLTAKATPTKGNISPNLRRLFALYENLIQFVLPLCSAMPNRLFPDTPVSQSSNIVDISRTGLKQFWNLKGHMQEASTLATAHYPETLDRIFIIGAPSFFPTVWSWIKRWFDPITVSKIFIVSQNDIHKTLSEYIDDENIPKQYGGKLDWQWGHLPNLDKEIEEVLEWKKPTKGEHDANVFPPGPIRWRNSKNGQTMSSIALGSVKGTQREDVIATMPVPPETALSKTPTRPGLDRFASTTTTGEYTHPSDDVDKFPSTGVTPVGTPVNSDAQSMSSKMSEVNIGNKGSRTVPVQQTDFASKAQTTTSNSQTTTSTSQTATSNSQTAASNPQTVASTSQTAAERQKEDRQGTSEMRQEIQAGTHAEGVHAHATPAVIDHGHRDKSKAVEPSTIAQGPKDVTVPEKKEEEPDPPSYVEQAKSAVGGAAANIGAVGTGLAEKVGISAKSCEDQKKDDEEQVKGEESSKDDPKVDKMGDVEVEDFIRSKYATRSNPSARIDKYVEE